MSSYAHKHIFFYLHAQANMNTLFTDPAQNYKKSKKKIKVFCKKNLQKFITRKIFVVEHSAWRQMKENYQIYLPYQFHWRPHSVDREP